MPPYNPDRAQRLIAEALDGHDATPAFYGLTGSHIYGFDSQSSDIDIRGFHIAPAEQYAYLNSPQEEITINMDGTTEGYEEYEELDFRSYSLAKFGSLLSKANYTTMELIFCSDTIMNPFAEQMDSLRDTIERHLPLNTPHAYRGLAMNYYHGEGISGDEPTDPKTYLYAYRAALGAQYVAQERAITADIYTIANAISTADTVLIDDLIAAKRAENGPASATLHERASQAIAEELERIDGSLPNAGNKTQFRADIDSWMNDLRTTASER